jgi:hypothetical protein
MMFPMDLNKRFPNQYRNYLKALKDMDFEKMKIIEAKVSKNI